jgi:hypothetical protein
MTTTSSPAAIKPAKVITWETNFNNKLGCPAFIHIDLSPVQYPLRQELENRIIEIRTKDNSFPPVQVRVDNIQTVTFQQINDMMAWVSHGLRQQWSWQIFFSTNTILIFRGQQK